MQKKSYNENTRINLQQAYLDLAYNGDHSKINISDITEKAHYHRSTFYTYYSGIEELIGEIETNIYKLSEMIAKGLADEQRSKTREAVIDLCMKIVKNYDYKVLYFIRENQNHEFQNKLKTIFLPVLKTQFDNTKYNDYQIELMSSFFFSGLMATLINYYSDPQITKEEFLELLIDLLTLKHFPY